MCIRNREGSGKSKDGFTAGYFDSGEVYYGPDTYTHVEEYDANDYIGSRASVPSFLYGRGGRAVSPTSNYINASKFAGSLSGKI